MQGAGCGARRQTASSEVARERMVMQLMMNVGSRAMVVVGLFGTYVVSRQHSGVRRWRGLNTAG